MRMNKVFGLVVIMVGMLLTVGAGANFRYYQADRPASTAIVPDDDELISLTALQPYVTYNDGVLYIKMAEGNANRPEYGGLGMSPNTTYVFEEMFEVGNNLWENNQSDYPVCVHISSTSLKIFVGNYTNPIAGPGHSVQFVVYHGQPVPVGVVFNNTNVSMGQYQTQLNIEAYAGLCMT